MFTINGKYANATIYTDHVEPKTLQQITLLLRQKFTEGSSIKIMPDCHAGKGCVIGTTMTFTDKVVPCLVGADIGCGVLAIKLKQKNIDLKELDQTIRKFVPHGYSLHNHDVTPISNPQYENIKAKIEFNRVPRSLGTLGGGNHFIAIETDDEFLYLIIHSGSRHLGNTISNYYSQVAANKYLSREDRDSLPPELAYLDGNDMENYINDALIAQQFARQNRFMIAQKIMKNMNLDMFNFIDTVHNYIEKYDDSQFILRKGAVKADYDELLIIPLNMRDGSIICRGKGNPEWNKSAPHGAGRVLSRSEAKATLSMNEYEKTMNGIYTTSINRSTLDESPMAYKPADEIIKHIHGTVTVEKHIKPIYNFKSSK